MTMKRSWSLKIQYVRGTEDSDPKLYLGLDAPLLRVLKALFYWLIGREVWLLLTEDDIERLSHQIVRWRVIKKLRVYKRHAKTK